MAYDVKFYKGTSVAYSSLATKDDKCFYYTTDDRQLYLGAIKLSSEDTIGLLSSLTTTNKDSIVAAINELKSKIDTLVGSGSGSITDMIEDITGDLNDLIVTIPAGSINNLVDAINTLENEIIANKTDATVSVEEDTTDTTVAKKYIIKQGSTAIGTINIPKDMVVSAGRVVTLTDGEVTDVAAGKYVELTIANATNDKIYIAVNDLVDAYTAETSATQVQLAIDSNNEISATIVAKSITATELADAAVTNTKIANSAITKVKIADNSVSTNKIEDNGITKAKLATDVKDSLNKADSALQEADISTGTANGNITVGTKQVPIYGLKSAAYAEASAFDAAGAASDALKAAKEYVDTALTWREI